VHKQVQHAGAEALPVLCSKAVTVSAGMQRQGQAVLCTTENKLLPSAVASDSAGALNMKVRYRAQAGLLTAQDGH